MELVPAIQGIYYVITGLWPAFNISSFEKITGPKTDKWLVKMVGLLAAAIGTVLLLSNGEEIVKILGILSATSFVIIDFIYAFKRRIPLTYLGDGLLQLAFIIGWLVT